MAEIVSKHGFKTTKSRSNTMRQIQSKNTYPEVRLRKALWKKGVRYRINNQDITGNPDIAIRKYKLAIFVDGEFWHGYNWEEKRGKIKSNREYWIKKIEGNMQRDLRVNEALKRDGWTILRFWEKEIKNNLPSCVDMVLKAI